MKRFILVLLAAVLASGAFAQEAFPDIPANHWAGDAVERIADLGIVIGFPDGTFRGNEAFTRYQAALVVSRLLDVINENVDAALALTRADLDSLRNAVQELASDVAAQGVRLSAAESAIAGLADDNAVTNARLDDLEAALANAGVDPAVLRDLQNQLASQRVAIDTAQAQADAAADRADDAYNLARQADTRSRQNAEDVASINRVLGFMQQDIADLENRPVAGAEVDLDGVNAAIERNRSDIANIREFVILLRRDQVAIRDRVSALEASDAAQDAAISDLQARVTALEENPLGINGRIFVRYRAGRTLGGYYFDVDRVYGLNNDRDMGSSVFSSGTAEYADDKFTSSLYRTESGEVAQDRHDIADWNGRDILARLSLSFDYDFSFDGQGSPRALNGFSGVVDVSLDTRHLFAPLPPAPERESDPDEGVLLADWIRVDRFMTTFEPIGATPLTFTFGTNVETSFTPYVVGTNDPGFLATVTAPDFLAFLDPTLQAVYTAPDDNTYLRGARLTVSPLDGLTVGGSFAQQAELAGDKDDVNDDNLQITVFGADASLALSIFELNFEWAQGSSNDNLGTDSETILYAELGVDASDLPIIDSLSANYRSISENWTAYGYDLGADADAFPYSEDQSGFGVNAGFDLFGIVELDGYFDTFTTFTTDESTMAFGVDAKANIFAGFSLGGWFHQASVEGEAVDTQRFAVDADENDVTLTDMRRNGNNFDTSFGVRLAHDGDADNALIKGLNFAASYSQSEADFSRTNISASADYTLNVSIVELTPYVGYTMSNDADTDGATRGEAYRSQNQLKVGTGLTTTPLDVFLQPSLMAAVNYRSASYTRFDDTSFDASELQWSVGLVLNEFLFENSRLTAKYGSWTGTNVHNALNTRRQADGSYADTGTGDGATDISRGDLDGSDVQTTTGYEVIWNYWDLEFGYGVYENSDARGDASAQAFSISYTVTF